MLNLIVFPFHSMRKNQKDGFRNRDGHFIESFAASNRVEKVLVVNRPATYAEVVYSRTTWKTKGKIIKKTNQARLVQLSDKLYSIDYLSMDIIGNLKNKKNWFWDAYADPRFIDFIKQCTEELGMTSFSCTYHNVYASSAVGLLNADVELFDAFDNWLKFPMFSDIYGALKKGYHTFAEKAHLWITNSDENKNFFEREFGATSCTVLKNGVDVERFSKGYPMPADLQNIKRPIIGFGGTITHLFDVDLFNRIITDHPDKSFVIVGKVLDKEVFRRLQRSANLHYLGNKHYDEYPSYVKHFDICIITYHSGNKAHGGDSLKFYEYLASGKNMVTTSGNGIFKAHEHVFISDDYAQFSANIESALGTGSAKYHVPSELTWSHKADWIISAIANAKLEKENLA
jgi:teichuronic acid biosynthesis glycosyltransferase TuaH